MSHIVTIQIKMHDPAAVKAACRRLGLAEPMHGTAELYSDKATGLIVKLPGWEYPAVIDTLSGSARYDNFGGIWGDQVHLDRFMQAYEVEKARIEANKKGFPVTEQLLQDGYIKLEILEGY